MKMTNAFWLVLLMALGVACGNDADFAGNTPDRQAANVEVEETGGEEEPEVEEPPPEEPPPLPEPFSALTWHWQCSDDPGVLPEPEADDEVVVANEGPHEFQPERLDGTPIVFSGELCPPEVRRRDLLFVIDVSGSMNTNDPRVGDSCGRLTALQQVMASLPADIGAYSIITFSNALGTNFVSSAFYPSQQELFDATTLATGGTIADTVCAAGGGTDYALPLTSAQDLLALGRVGATKEIYLISDGEPEFGREGIAEATTLKNVGVTVGADVIPTTIATVMLKTPDGTVSILEESIASRPDGTNPLHSYVADTNTLAQTLTELADNEIVGGELKYRAIGDESWTKLDLIEHLEGFEFTLPSFSIDRESAPQGIEVLYEYWDRHDNRYESGGTLLWVAADKSNREDSEDSDD